MFGAEDGKEGKNRDRDEDADSKVLGDKMGLLARFSELEQEMDDGSAAFEDAYSSFRASLPSSTWVFLTIEVDRLSSTF